MSLSWTTCLRWAAALFLGLPHPSYSQVASPAGLRLQIPAAVAPERVIIYYQVKSSGGDAFVPPGGSGTAFTRIVTSAGVREYRLATGNAATLRLLVYAPGYWMVARDFQARDFARPFVPVLTPLSSARLSGVLVDSSKRPLSGRTLELTYMLGEVSTYFGVMDGPATYLGVGRAVTGDDGGFTFDAPVLSDDPFFQNQRGPQRFELNLDGRARWSDENTLRPSDFDVAPAYDKPFIVQKLSPGTLVGKLDAALLAKHGLPPDLTPYVNSSDGTRPLHVQLSAKAIDNRPANGERWYTMRLEGNGSYERLLPPGTYDLELSLFGPGFVLIRKSTVEQNVGVEEGRRTAVGSQSASSVPFVGLAARRSDGRVCAAMPAPALPAGTTVTLVPPAGRRSTLGLLAPASSCEPLERALVRGPSYNVIAADGPSDSDLFWVVFSGAVPTRLVGDALTVRLNDTLADGQVRSCASGEGLHLTLWSGTPLISQRLWHQYYYLGYDTQPTCEERDTR